MKGWIQGNGPHNDIILSSRVRLARNLANTPFTTVMDENMARDIINQVRNAARREETVQQFNEYVMGEMQPIDRQVLVEKHLISPGLAKNTASGAAIISSNQEVSIMINEEDHIRIQAIMPGLQIKKAWEMASEIDDLLERSLDYAYDEKLGYLTSCPTNVGTGMRASVMVHLPGLNLTGNINQILQAVTQIGLTIRGLYGEGTEMLGNIFQVSNQITLGRAEEEIVDNLTAVTMQIIEKEKEARNILLVHNRIQIEDKIWRSLGIMRNARMMSSQECLKLLSDLRLGVDLGIISSIPVSLLNEIMVETQAAGIQKRAERELAPVERDILRAEIVREKLRE